MRLPQNTPKYVPFILNPSPVILSEVKNLSLRLRVNSAKDLIESTR